jgi:hypothetical protein
VWSASTREHVSREQAETAIATATRRIFEAYPGRGRGGKN